MNMHYEKVIGFLAGVVVLGLVIYGAVSNYGKVGDMSLLPTGATTGDQVPPTQSISDYLKAPMLSAAETADWKTYTNDNFEIKYPKDFTVNEKYTNETLGPGKVRQGVSFTIPASMALGTNLSKDSLISIEEVANGRGVCGAESFIDQALITKPQVSVAIKNKYNKEEINTIVQTTGAGAGNFYEEIVMAMKPPVRCLGIRLFIHSTNIGNYDPGTVKEFDRIKLLSIFATMASSLEEITE